MIDNVKDLSRVEKIKIIERRFRWQSFLKCLFPMIVAGASMAVYGMFMFGNLIYSFEHELIQSIGKILIGIILMGMLFLTMYEFAKKKSTNVRDYWITSFMLIVTFIVSLSLAKLVNIYILPLALAAYVTMELISRRVAMLSTVIMAFMLIIMFAFSNEPETFYYSQAFSSIIVNVVATLFVVFMEKLHFSRIKFLIMSLVVPLVSTPLNAILTILQNDFSLNILFNILYSYAGCVGAALCFMPLVTLFEAIFNVADDFRLNELCSLSSPLLKRLASEAPGTFNHSLVVGNLAEACASAIGENPNMARCGAYYHDIGKLKAPIYFSENQSTYNPHDELIPEVSVSMITSHTLFGEILAKQARLPKEIVDICRQHHGTSPVSYFYRKALTLKEEGELAVDQYKYSGPKPQTKIAAIIMISDTIEAAMRAFMPETKDEYEQRIEKLVDEKIALNQFDECPITMGDIAIIKKTIIEVLPSIHHSRVNYDKNKK